MNKKLVASTILLASLTLTGCTYKTSVGVSPVDLSKSDMSKLSSSKVGEACQTRILLIPVSRDMSARKAAENGGISHIRYQETTSTSFWPFYDSKCLKVYGE